MALHFSRLPPPLPIKFCLRKERIPAKPVGEVPIDAWREFAICSDKRLFSDLPRLIVGIEQGVGVLAGAKGVLSSLVSPYFAACIVGDGTCASTDGIDADRPRAPHPT